MKSEASVEMAYHYLLSENPFFPLLHSYFHTIHSVGEQAAQRLKTGINNCVRLANNYSRT